MSTEVDEQVTTPVLSDADIFRTDVAPVPPAIPEVHQGTITGVSLVRLGNEKGSVKIVVGVKSENSPFEGNLDLFIPPAFAENIHVNYVDLPGEDGNNQQMSFRIAIANSKDNAAIQQWQKLPRDKEGNYLPGRSATEVGITAAPTDIDSYVETYNKLLTGLPILFTRRADKPKPGGDPRFEGMLRVQELVPRFEQDNPKRFKPLKETVNSETGAVTYAGYQKMWEL